MVEEFWTSAEEQWETGVKRIWPTKLLANGLAPFSPIVVDRLKIAGVDPWSHYCWLNLRNLLEARGPNATLNSFLEPTEDDPVDGFDEWMGAPVQYKLMGDCKALSFGNHSRPHSRSMTFPNDPRATALLQPIPRIGDNASRSSEPVEDETPINWVKGTLLPKVGCVYDPSRRVPSSRDKKEKDATRGLSAKEIKEARKAFGSSSIRKRPDNKIFASSGSDRKRLPSDWDPRSDERFEAGSAIDRKPGDGESSYRSSQSSVPHVRTSSGHKSSRSQDAKRLEPLNLISRRAAGKERASGEEPSDGGSSSRTFDERRIKSMRSRPAGQDDQPNTLLLAFRPRAVSYFTREVE